jgi:hypothetical protein
LIQEFATACRSSSLDSVEDVALSPAVTGNVCFSLASRLTAVSLRWLVSTLVALTLVVGGVGHSHANVPPAMQANTVFLEAGDANADAMTTDGALPNTCHCVCVPALISPIALPASMGPGGEVPTGLLVNLHGTSSMAESPPPRALS